MKALFTLLGLILSYTLSAQVAEYFSCNPKWREHRIFAPGFPCLEINNYMYYLNGDSAIGNHIYKKIYDRHLIEYSWMAGPPSSNCEGSESWDQFTALVRQENRKIYLYSDGLDNLLYDFDLAVGDTLPATWNYRRENNIIVTSVDSIMVRDGYRKIFNLSYELQNQNTLIEGIGFASGFLDQFPDWEFPSTLQCFTLNDTAYYPSYGYSCDIALGLPQANAPVGFNMFPNPVIDHLTIETAYAALIGQVFAYDLIGHKIPLTFSHTKTDVVTINFSGLQTGIYLLQLQGKRVIPINIKVIKQ